MTPRYIAAALHLLAALAGAEVADASCIRVGNPKAIEVELVSCTTAKAYFDANYHKLHPATPEPKAARPVDPRTVFSEQLTHQPGVVIEVKVLRLREYADDPTYSWRGAWELELRPKIQTVYLRRPDRTCNSIEEGAVTQLIPAPQCCDTGYFGEIGCHLKLSMVQYLPDSLREDSPPGRAQPTPAQIEDASPNSSLQRAPFGRSSG